MSFGGLAGCVGRLHGPYHQWTRKKDGKTVSRILTDDQLADYQPWVDNHRRLHELIAEIGSAARPRAAKSTGAQVPGDSVRTGASATSSK